jgi:hypothetical protein
MVKFRLANTLYRTAKEMTLERHLEWRRKIIRVPDAGTSPTVTKVEMFLAELK